VESIHRASSFPLHSSPYFQLNTIQDAPGAQRAIPSRTRHRTHGRQSTLCPNGCREDRVPRIVSDRQPPVRNGGETLRPHTRFGCSQGQPSRSLKRCRTNSSRAAQDTCSVHRSENAEAAALPACFRRSEDTRRHVVTSLRTKRNPTALRRGSASHEVGTRRNRVVSASQCRQRRLRDPPSRRRFLLRQATLARQCLQWAERVDSEGGP